MVERLREELTAIQKDPIYNCGLTVGLINEDSYYDWKISLTAPKDEDIPYRGGLFFLNAHFPPDYPNSKPEVFFITPIYHLNIKPTAKKSEEDESLGHVCISTLNWWNPARKMKEVLLNIYSLFFMHNPDSPYGTERAKEFNEEKGVVYFEKAKKFTKKYANPKNQKEYDRTQDWDFN